jgi:hypothetical protein
MTQKGLPHSEIPGSKPVCGSPGLIAACHVLHRLCAPRHPPSTLSSLTIKYLRRVVCILIYPILLSKTVISSDQKALEKFSGAVSSVDPPSHFVLWRDQSAVARFASPGVRFVSMVEPIGIEPTTYGLQSRRSPN